MAEIATDPQIVEVLRNARTVAVLGAHHEPSRPAFYVPDYLHTQGYRILPVNPAFAMGASPPNPRSGLFAGKQLWGQPVRATLAELGEPVDIVDVFRRPDLLPGHLDDILAMAPRPRLVWLQLGIRNDAFARAVEAAGIDVVQDRCTLADHRRLGVGRVAPSA